MANEAAAKIVSDVLRQRFGASAFTAATTTEEEDFDGAQVLRVIAHFSQPVANNALIDSISDIREELLKQGDRRYVLLTIGDSNADSDPDQESDDDPRDSVQTNDLGGDR